MTTTLDNTVRDVLNLARPDQLADVLAKIKFGNMASLIKITVTGLTAIAAPDITTAAVKAAAVIEGITLKDGEMLPAIGEVISCRVTASGTANSVGSYAITDAGGTGLTPTAGANVGLAKLADDGKAITFLTTVTAFVLVYRPRPAVALNSAFLLSAP